MITLGIETSCDDTSAAILENDSKVLSSIISSQDTIHEPFGGIVPELASRRHMECITLIVERSLCEARLSLGDISLVSVTQGPGLIGSLLVGFSYAKALSYTLKVPFVGVDHMTGHILSAFLEPEIPTFPYIALIASGGTTALYQVNGFMDCALLGRTRDDAAGEAYDKVARLLGLGYPGGPAIAGQALYGNDRSLRFPRAWLEDNSLDFSFSGLKTAVMNHCNQSSMKNENVDIAAVCASFQEAVADVLVEKSISAVRQKGLDTLVLGGGVSANDHLREQMTARCDREGIGLFLPDKKNCTDNGAMIAFSGLKRFQAGIVGTFADDVFSRSHLGR
ncbi:MAG: tRNA (adenosine(37)-N6)-threonylcarbamoyltransferase complex transferase subunit TsaD [Desulfocapsaceae bacterium]|jgi:N6-L-threonylcarbamoyladenine synthase|nr:tRNA (adenosine(37)-N6)-threonylcarbamoyltransferase complex transferase subunit TsaD [Desulfocapsaceae bacterium]